MSLPVEPTLGCKVGWRGWMVFEPGLLTTSYTVWLPDERTEAVCLKCGEELPGERCSCGIYAFKKPAQVFADGYHQQDLLGEVWLWGRVVEHERGWRAQYAAVKRLYFAKHHVMKKISSHSYSSMREEQVGAALMKAQYVAFRYGVELEVIEQEHELLSGDAEERRRREEERRLGEERRAAAARNWKLQESMKRRSGREALEAKAKGMPATKPGFKNLLEQVEAEAAAEVKRRLGR